MFGHRRGVSAFRRACGFTEQIPNFLDSDFARFEPNQSSVFEVQRRGRVRYVQPSPGLGNGRGACVIGARLGAVICIGSAGLDRGGRFPMARSRCAALPCSPAAVIAARLNS